MYYHCEKRTVIASRGVQIRSESDPIGFVRISEPKYSFRIGSIKLFRSRIGSDRTSISEIKWINYPRIIARINYHAFIKASSRLSLHYSFDTSIGRHFVSFLTCISCFYIYLVKYFKFHLLTPVTPTVRLTTNFNFYDSYTWLKIFILILDNL
jgi:hypothetical protein